MQETRNQLTHGCSNKDGHGNPMIAQAALVVCSGRPGIPARRVDSVVVSTAVKTARNTLMCCVSRT